MIDMVLLDVLNFLKSLDAQTTYTQALLEYQNVLIEVKAVSLLRANELLSNKDRIISLKNNIQTLQDKLTLISNYMPAMSMFFALENIKIDIQWIVDDLPLLERYNG